MSEHWPSVYARARLPLDADGRLDGFSIVGRRDRISEWVARRDDPNCSKPARARWSYPDPIACPWCGAVFCPVSFRAGTRYCSKRHQTLDYEQESPEEWGEKQRKARKSRARSPGEVREDVNLRDRDARRKRRKKDPAFRKAEAAWSKAYRKRKREG